MNDDLKTFLINYGFEGKQYSFDLVAKNADEAIRRLEAIKSWSRIEGTLFVRIPVPSFFERIVRKISGHKD